ncbi:unnamed protein product [Lathyrus oleraceus]
MELVYKLKSFVSLLAIILLLISSMMVIDAQSSFKHGRKLFQNPAPTYKTGEYGGYVSYPP